MSFHHLRRPGEAKILLSIQWIEKYSCQAVAIGVQPTKAAAEASAQGKRRINPAITKR
jgi:hypothetical protein